MKHGLKTLGFLLVVSFLLAGYALQAEDRPILTLGFILTLTGDFADMGAASRNGAELAKQDHPDLFRSVRVVYEDSSYQGRMAVSAYRKLTTSDRADIIFVWGDAPSAALAPLAEADKVPLIVSSTDTSVSKGKHFVMRFHYDSQQLAAALIDYLHEQQYHKLAIIKTQMAFTDNLVDNMRQRLAADQTMDVVDDYQLNDNDFKPSLLKVKSKAYDAVGAFVFGGQIPQFFKQLSALGITIPTFGSDSFENRSLITEAGGLMSGTVYAQLPIEAKWHERYAAKYEGDHQVGFAAKAYDFTTLCGALLGALKQHPSGEEVLGLLRGSGHRQGVEGGYYYDPGVNGFHFPVVMKRIDGPQIQEFGGKY